jgi:hypothetical protein
MFAKLEVQNQIEYQTIGELVNWCMSEGWVPDLRDAVGKYLRGKKLSTERPPKCDKTLLLIDEVDVLFGEQFHGETFNPCVRLDPCGPSDDVIRYVWNMRADWRERRSNGTDVKEVAKEVKDKACGPLLKEFPNLAPLVEQSIVKMLDAVLAFPDPGSSDEPTHPYVPDRLGRRIGYVSHGEISYSTVYPFSTAFAELKEFGHLDDFSPKEGWTVTCGNILYSEIPCVALSRSFSSYPLSSSFA